MTGSSVDYQKPFISAFDWIEMERICSGLALDNRPITLSLKFRRGLLLAFSRLMQCNLATRFIRFYFGPVTFFPTTAAHV